MDAFSHVISAAHSGATGTNGLAHPSVDQLRAGNYAKGRVVLHGLRIAIETPAGQRRTGKTDGQPWSVICMAHYGEFSGTKGADGDPLDVFIGPWPESELAWVVNRSRDGDGGFDEHKILIGFPDGQSAITAYRNSYERGRAGDASVVPCSIEQLKWWIKYGDHTVPLTKNQLPYDGAALMNDVTWDSTATPAGVTIPELMYALRRQDQEEQLLLDRVCSADVVEGSDGEAVLDAMVVKLNQLERKLAQMQVIMRAAGGEVRPVAMQVTPPFRQRGTTNIAGIIELSDGQTIAIYFHNPDTTPNKLTPDDEMVSWKWMLNKKDITIIVAPERGRDLNPREVARRVMRLAEANSGRFQAANAKRSERLANIEHAKAAIEGKQAELVGLNAEIERLEPLVEAKRNTPPANLQKDDHTDRDQGQDSAAAPTRSGTTEEQAKADAALLMAADVVAQLGGTFANDGHSGPGTVGAWSYGNATVNGIDVRLAASGGGVVQVNRKPHGLDGSLILTPEQVRAAILAVAPEPVWRSVDPTTEAGYAQVNAAGEDALLWHQDQLDSFFGSRYVAIRNELRKLGWNDDGSQQMGSGPLKKGEFTLDPQIKHIGAGRNVVGINYQITGVPGFFMSDDLSRSVAEMAGGINLGVPERTAPTDDQLVDAHSYLQSVIDGAIDLSSPQVADRLTELHELHSGKAAFEELFSKAADAYQAFMVKAALAAMGELNA